MNLRHLVAVFSLLLTSLCYGGAEPERREWKIDGVAREAMLYVPESGKTTPAPLVFVYHGHGGTMQQQAARYQIHKLWPEAIVIYPQGLNIPGMLTDKEGKKPGWQQKIGQVEDRDLKFFDAMLQSLKSDYKVDEKRIYCTGHSNGGLFTYLLWAARGDVFAAVAPTAAVLTPDLAPLVKPKPALHLAGQKDTLVKFEWQEATMKSVRALNQCGEGQPWGDMCTLYSSSIGTPFVSLIHPGAHNFPKDAEKVIVKFFKEQVKK